MPNTPSVDRNYKSFAKNFSDYVEDPNCIRGSKVILRNTLRIVHKELMRAAKEFCRQELVYYGKYAPELARINPKIQKEINASILYAQGVNRQKISEVKKMGKFVW